MLSAWDSSDKGSSIYPHKEVLKVPHTPSGTRPEQVHSPSCLIWGRPSPKGGPDDTPQGHHRVGVAGSEEQGSRQTDPILLRAWVLGTPSLRASGPQWQPDTV
jgi:hypothetical protein